MDGRPETRLGSRPGQPARHLQHRLQELAARAETAKGVAEELAPYVRPHGRVQIDFGGDPELVRLIVEAERLTYGHLFSPSFATEISLIDPLPHQRIAVYEHMLTQPRLRFLLADDAGAGKTIMAGLYVQEMLSRRLLRRPGRAREQLGTRAAALVRSAVSDRSRPGIALGEPLHGPRQ
jgi:hypothetical protein